MTDRLAQDYLRTCSLPWTRLSSSLTGSIPLVSNRISTAFAVVRALEIIGEASKRVPAPFCENVFLPFPGRASPECVTS